MVLTRIPQFCRMHFLYAWCVGGFVGRSASHRPTLSTKYKVACLEKVGRAHPAAEVLLHRVADDETGYIAVCTGWNLLDAVIIFGTTLGLHVPFFHLICALWIFFYSILACAYASPSSRPNPRFSSRVSWPTLLPKNSGIRSLPRKLSRKIF